MRLIQVAEAAKRLGVSRQTLENWGKNGTLKIRTIGKPVNSHWVDADTIEALADFNPKVINIKDKPYKNTIARMKQDLATTTSSISDKTQPHKQ